MLINSIYFRMTFWYVLALGVIAGILSIFLYVNFSRVLNKDFDHLLESRAQDIAQVIDEELKDAIRNKKNETTVDFSNVEFTSTLHNAVEWSRGDGLFIQVFRQDGKEVVRSSNMFFPMSLMKASVPGETFFDTPGFPSSKNEIWPFRTLVLRVKEDGNSHFIQVTASLRPLCVKLGRIKTVLVFFLPLAMILVTIMGFFLTRATLKPVDNMTRTMRQITSRNLKQRINIPAVNDETRRLAETFNDMLTRLDNAFSLQQQLIQDVSHELRTPLTVLKGKQEIALNKQRTQEEYQDILSVNLEEIDKMNALVENLLTLAQLDSAEINLKFQKEDLTDIMRQVISDAQPQAEQKGITLALLSSNEVVIDADKGQLRRVLCNIIDNAVKYTPQDGHISIRVSQKGPLGEITVNDTGIGIAKEDLPRVFDRFFRAEKSRSSPGFGLGLSIAKGIVTAHKGTIRVESEPAQGTTFIISIPIHQT